MPKRMLCMMLVCLLLLTSGCGAASASVSSSAFVSASAADSDCTCDSGTAANARTYTSDTLSFSAPGLDGNTYTMDAFKDAKVIMVNYWEPWCSPCIGEMPELESLYEKYQDQGFVILGVYATRGMDADARDILEECGVTYPVVRADEGLMEFEQSFVPATIFVAPDGTLLTPDCYAGAKSFEQWDEIISSFLG